MTLEDFGFIKTSKFEMVVYVAGEHKIVITHYLLPYLKKIIEPLMRFDLSIAIEPVPIEKPKFMWILLEECWVCSICKTHIDFFEIRVCFP